MKIRPILLFLAVLGLFDAGYLTYHHYTNFYLPCGTTIDGCNLVLSSSYAVVFGIPLALYGVIYYLTLLVLIFSKLNRRILVAASAFGLLASAYFVYLQLFVIKAICYYCMGSAATSTLIFILTQKHMVNERVWFWSFVTSNLYKGILKPILFLFDPEIVHENMLAMGEVLGKSKVARSVLSFMFRGKGKQIELAGITFKGKVGMAAGFDYTASLPFVVPSLGFGFTTIGSITNHAYEGNPAPRLGRLPRSKSLMVNKGFKNPGAVEIVEKLKGRKFAIPVGISIGRTNRKMTQQESVADIVSAFEIIERAKLNNSFYELNISCPNLFGSVDFYTPQKLSDLLTALAKLKIKKPVFIKMPINLTISQTLSLLKTIADSAVVGVIIGNLQKDRMNKSLVQEEVKQFKTGFFSGKPTFERSNELIRLTRKTFGNRFVIIGCGGVFTTQDAKVKLDAGADLVQLITGLIYEGPQLVSQINQEVWCRARNY